MRSDSVSNLGRGLRGARPPSCVDNTPWLKVSLHLTFYKCQQWIQSCKNSVGGLGKLEDTLHMEYAQTFLVCRKDSSVANKEGHPESSQGVCEETGSKNFRQQGNTNRVLG